MSIKESHKRRVEKIRAYVSSNRMFLAMAALAAILLLSGGVFFQGSEDNKTAEEQAQTQETDDISWRFYPIDGLILLVGGGFCGIQIVREKRKARRE